ncbi:MULTISPECIES: hypothetical protein [Chryseobacterium]|uniref:Circularly permuted type 2 ATP-grasp protein n=1 Tax=Chryseobacterium camelliae TaxID=1265445 RepID=A0ABU0TH65_9FLAO|nr:MULTISPECIES: hypothetical protein [Chryseobacterium]MDT3405796.1 hypothetical protein [Pseudacidovorax intermedius]MDQ1096397.1 hypothetical protein [Chryseobacterium camelliae]MDQ1100337.1 hypothetical protein [Chryseobacterium sp. SORGH_AS_1048]MDR6087679.1 hypothetical protein [Chryseobacterium sp. SORGH_AS_0909]MDR6132054.1 hypothetical protein [Chryseobacterium sp. SORGH_AS_1175]
MIQEYREQFNREFSQEKYAKLKSILKEKSGTEPAFRISESPVFLSHALKIQLTEAAESIIDQIKAIAPEILRKAVPERYNVPNDTQHPHFFTIDFGICADEKGTVVPRLIELQAFPSLYTFQKVYEDAFCETYPFLSEIRNDMPEELYIHHLKKVILGDESPEHVILLEIFPEQQKTAIDFLCTENMLGIKTVCLTQIKKQGRKLFYDNNGKQTEIRRIYNRVIFDELEHIPDLKAGFDFREDLDVQWVTHPNWFFKISKFILPLLKHPLVPKSYFLHEFPDYEDLGNFVLKPLFSFAGSGVDLHPAAAVVEAIKDKENYILQRKVQYEPAFKDINGDYSKAEIRLLYVWHEDEERPVLLNNLARMTKADMVNVSFNKKDAIWIGSSHAFFIKE